MEYTVNHVMFYTYEISTYTCIRFSHSSANIIDGSHNRKGKMKTYRMTYTAAQTKETTP